MQPPSVFLFIVAAACSDNEIYGDPLCSLDGHGYQRCCGEHAGNYTTNTCWMDESVARGSPREFFPERCCNDILAASALEYGAMLQKGRVLRLLHEHDRPGVIVVRNIPGLADILTRFADSWYDFDASPGIQDAVFQNDETIATLLSDVVRWLLDALIRDLLMVNAPGPSELTALLCGALLGHVRHFEYNRTEWEDTSKYVDTSRWMPYFHLHRDAFWVSVQTQPSMGGETFHDGTFALDSSRRMHRVRIGPGDVAVWFGSVMEHISNGYVRAAQHMVFAHHSYRHVLKYRRRVTMFHIYPHTRDVDTFREWSLYGPPAGERRGKLWYESEAQKRASFSNIFLPGGTCFYENGTNVFEDVEVTRVT